MTAPCNPYISHDELAECCDHVDLLDSPGESPTEAAASTLLSRQTASSVLFYATGQQYAGLCDVFVRPSYECSPCDTIRWTPTLIDGSWLNLRCGSGCPCSQERCAVSLSQYGHVEIVNVFVDGIPLDPTEYFYSGGKLYRIGECWPSCNKWDHPAFPDGYPDESPGEFPGEEFEGTFGVHLIAGVETPEFIKQATRDLACHYQNLCDTNCKACDVAIGLARRPNTTIDYALNEVIPWVYIGLQSVDTAIRIANPYGFPRVKATIWSPEANEHVTEYL